MGESICPISHIPLINLHMPVVFRGKKPKVVYDAEHLVCWLREGRMVDPVTNEVVREGQANEILEPCWLEHLTAEEVQKTMKYLKNEGYLGTKQELPSPLRLFVYFILAVVGIWFWRALETLVQEIEALAHSPTLESAMHIVFL